MSNATEGFYNTEEVIDTAEMVNGAEDFTKTDIMYYLEEMIQMDEATEIEMNVYYNIKLTKRFKPSEMKHVKRNMKDMYENKF